MSIIHNFLFIGNSEFLRSRKQKIERKAIDISGISTEVQFIC